MMLERKAPPGPREFRAWARFKEDEAIWPAQVVTWLPLASQVSSILFLLFGILAGGPMVGRLVGMVTGTIVLLIFASLYGLAGAWIGERQSRGIWLAIGLFGWSLAAHALFGRLLTLGAAYDVLALVLVIRAGRAIGVRYLTSAA